MKINPRKFDFFRSEVTFLGHKCTSNGFLPDDSKLVVVKNYPVPKDKDAVKRFVALTNYYRRLIPNFAAIAAPLNQIIRKRVYLIWDEKSQNSFEKLKSELTSSRILQYPDFTKQFFITVT